MCKRYKRIDDHWWNFVAFQNDISHKKRRQKEIYGVSARKLNFEFDDDESIASTKSRERAPIPKSVRTPWKQN